jgi:hypothetical protein
MQKTVDLVNYKNIITGYFRVRTIRLKDVNAEHLYQKFVNQTFTVPDFLPGSIDLWVRYQAHIFLMDQLKNKSDVFYKLYIELVYSYSAFYKKAEFEHYKSHYPEQLFFNVEITTAPLRTLVSESGYPNRTLCYCFKSLLNHWTPQRIAAELCSLKLDSMLDFFISEYVEQSGMHKLFVDYMFLPLRKGLNETLNYYIELYGNDDEKFLQITRNILFTRTGSSKLDDYFGVSELQRKAHMISVWCSRIKSSLVQRIIQFLKIQDYYCDPKRRLPLK